MTLEKALDEFLENENEAKMRPKLELRLKELRLANKSRALAIHMVEIFFLKQGLILSEEAQYQAIKAIETACAIGAVVGGEMKRR